MSGHHLNRETFPRTGFGLAKGRGGSTPPGRYAGTLQRRYAVGFEKNGNALSENSGPLWRCRVNRPQDGALAISEIAVAGVSGLWWLILRTAIILAGVSWGFAEPFVPRSADMVIDRVRSPQLSAAAKEIRALENQLAGAPKNLPAALKLAGRLIEAGREEADSRRLSRAQAVLAPWLVQERIPVEAIFLRATIRQSLHEFDSSLTDLDLVIRREPAHTGAWLTRTMISCVRADFIGARASAANLIRCGDEYLAITAAANIASLTGESANALRRMEELVRRNPDAPSKVRAWALTLLGETAARRGEAARAEGFFRDALALAPRDPYVLGGLADLLLDDGRPAEAASLLENFKDIDSLLLRHAEASPGNRSEAVKILTRHIEINRACGVRVHLREEARICLRLLDQPARALALARENWAIQKEPADARVLLEAARATRDKNTEDELRTALQKQGLEDVSLGLPLRSY